MRKSSHPRIAVSAKEVWQVVMFAVAISIFWSASPAFPQDDQDRLFEHAVQAYNNNEFTEARKSFEAVTGARAEEAKQYVNKIKTYREAMTLGESVLNRSADELDAKNLDYAINQFEQALGIKIDGPRDPRGKLEKAKVLKAKLQKQSGADDEVWSKQFCQKALEAARARRYKEAVLYSCPLADDNPGYLCNGDEAIHLCQQMHELAELKADTRPKAAVPAVRIEDADANSLFAAANAAYERNNFAGAARLLQGVTANEQSKARQLLQRIESYQFFVKQAEESLRSLKYDQARANYQEAARIKADGPGEPNVQAMLMDLEQGISAFYAGNYDVADMYLAAYAEETTQRQDLAHFYLGASKISRFYLAGGHDRSLRDEALSEFRAAKQQGFKASNQEVSPKILKAYEQMNF